MANEMAKRGYAVLIHDGFSFASDGCYMKIWPYWMGGAFEAEGVQMKTLEELGIEAYTNGQAQHEHVNGEILLRCWQSYPVWGVDEDDCFGYSSA